MSFTVGDRVMRQNSDYGVMVGTIVETSTTKDSQGRLLARIKWDGGVRTWNLATVLQPLELAGYLALVERNLASHKRYQVKNRMSADWIQTTQTRLKEKYDKEIARLFGAR